MPRAQENSARRSLILTLLRDCLVVSSPQIVNVEFAPSFDSPDDADVVAPCFGSTFEITNISKGHSERVFQGLQ